MSKAVLIIDMPKTCGHCPCCDGEYGICEADEHRRECMVHNRPEWCPLKPYKNSIPKEWIEKQLQRAVAFTHSKAEGNIIDDGCVVKVVSASFTANVLVNLLADWEKENENRKGEEEK